MEVQVQVGRKTLNVQFEKVVSGCKEYLISRPQGGATLKQTLGLKAEAERIIGKELQLTRYQDVILSAIVDRKLLGKLIGAFYIQGEGTDKSGPHTPIADGELRYAKGIDPEKRVDVHPGDKQLVLDVYPDNFTASYRKRFGLDACLGPHYVAPVVVFELKQAEPAQVTQMLRVTQEGKVVLKSPSGKKITEIEVTQGTIVTVEYPKPKAPPFKYLN